MKHFEYNTRFEELRTLIPTPKASRHALKITEIKTGSFLKIDGVMYKVVDEYLYKHKKEEWPEYKLMNLVNESIIYIEVEVDDDVDVYLTDKESKLQSIGLTRADIASIKADDDFHDIVYENRKYEYEDNYQVQFKRKNDVNWQSFHAFEFEASGGRCITIEDWEDGEQQVQHSTKLSKGRLEIVSL
jgi:hypothetical protein